MPLLVTDLKVGTKYRVSNAKGLVATGTFTRQLKSHPYVGHRGLPAEIVEDDEQTGFYSTEEGYTFEEVKGGRRRKTKRRARKTRRSRK